ncbi:MAG: acyl-CoA dehydrogenase family protein, partial [bacterium]
MLQFKQIVRRFVDEELEPHAVEIDRTNVVPDSVIVKAREVGLFGLAIPEKYGGAGESDLAASVALEQLSHGPGGATFYIAPSAPAAAIRLAGTDE